MDIIFFCRDAFYDSVINTLTVAMSAQKGGKAVGIVFTGDALNSLCRGVIRWPESLAGMETRKTISKEAKNLALSIASSRDPREIDIKPLLLQAKESGVVLYACPTWSRLLRLTDKLPEWLNEIGMEKLVDEIMSSKKVIGGL